MRHAFDTFEVESKLNGVATLCFRVSGRADDYMVALKPKSWIERITTSGNAKALPNIIFKKSPLRGVKIVFVKDDGAFFRYTLHAWLLPFSFQSRPFQHVRQEVVQSFLQEFSKCAHGRVNT
jgi:hypothetical protein